VDRGRRARVVRTASLVLLYAALFLASYVVASRDAPTILLVVPAVMALAGLVLRLRARALARSRRRPPP
jgi:hypothetical protein